MSDDENQSDSQLAGGGGSQAAGGVGGGVAGGVGGVGGGVGGGVNYNPAAYNPGWSSESPQHLALMYIRDVHGASRNPCGYIPIKCFVTSLRGYCTWPKSKADLFRSWSETRTALISKPLEQSSGRLQEITRTKKPIPEVVIIVLYKVQPQALGINPQDYGGSEIGSSDNLDSSRSSGQRSNNGGNFGSGSGFGSGSRSGSGGGSGSRGRRGRCRRKRTCLCYPRCNGCSSRSRTDFSDWTGPRWGLVQQELIYILRNVIFVSADTVVGMKCRPHTLLTGTGCFGSNGPLQTASDFNLQSGGLAPPGWQSSGIGTNFPSIPTDQGFPSIGEEQYYLQYSYAEFKYRVRNPETNCVYQQFSQIIPW